MHKNMFEWHSLCSEYYGGCARSENTYVAEIRLGCFLLKQTISEVNTSEAMQFVYGATLEDFGIERDNGSK